MHIKLNQLVNLLVQHGNIIQLNSPLQASDIQSKLVNHQLACCDELIHLYTWANGTDEDVSRPMFRDERFISLDRGIELYHLVQDYQQDFDFFGLKSTKVVPFAELWGHLYVLYCDDFHKLHHPILSLGDELAIMYKSFDSMLDTCIAWWSQNPPDADVQDTTGSVWLQHNTVDGDPMYIHKLNVG
jgi:hypothetical protein